MNEIKKRMIVRTYIEFDDDDISTERLLALVCDTCHCEIEDVIDALVEEGLIHE